MWPFGVHLRPSPNGAGPIKRPASRRPLRPCIGAARKEVAMTSQHPYLEGSGGPHPAAVLWHLAGSAAPAVLALAAGLVLGRPAARALRGARLHWSWALIAAGSAFAMRGAPAGFAPAVVGAGA